MRDMSSTQLHRLKHLSALPVAGAIVFSGLMGIAWLGDLRAHVPAFLLLYGLCFVGYALALVSLRGEKKGAAGQGSEGPVSVFSRPMIGILGAALAFRLVLIGTSPSLSEDIYRYVWDGRVAAQGINPYRYAPEAEELRSLRDATIFPRINHPDIPTIYPPANQGFFWAVYKVAPGLWGMKGALFLVDVLTLATLLLLLRRLSRPLEWVLVYAWNPLVIVEISGSGHADVFGVFLMVASLFLFMSKRPISGSMLLALSTLTKFLPALLLPLMLPRNLKRAVFGIAIFALTIVVCYLPFAGDGTPLFSALETYTAKWRFNDSIFSLAFAAIRSLVPEHAVAEAVRAEGMTPDAVTLESRKTDLALVLTKVALGALFAGIYAAIVVGYWRRRARMGPNATFGFALAGTAALLLLAPTLHPWYLIWLLPLLAIWPNRALLLLTGTVMLSYWVLIAYGKEGIWQENPVVKIVEFAPVFGLLAYDAWKARGRKGKRSAVGRA